MEVGQSGAEQSRAAALSPPLLSPPAPLLPSSSPAPPAPPPLSDRSGTALGRLARLLALRFEPELHKHAVDSQMTKCRDERSMGLSFLKLCGM